MSTEAKTLSVHSPEALRDARDIGEARKESSLIRTERRHQMAVWRLQRGLLARMLQVGSATTDDLAPDLRATFKRNAANWRGAAVRRLVSEGLIKSAGMTKCRRASRHGSPLTLWEPVDPAAARERVAYLDRLIEAFEGAAPAADSADATAGQSPAPPATGGAAPRCQSVLAGDPCQVPPSPSPCRRRQTHLPGLSVDRGELWAVEPSIPQAEGRPGC